MSFGHPLLLLTLAVIPAALVVYRVVSRRRMRYAVRDTNVDVLAAVVAAGRPWRRWVAAGVFLLAVAALCVAVSRPHVHRLVANDNATVVLVLDVSGSMQAQDVKPTRLAAAQKALHAFLAKVPARLKVGLVLFAGEAEVATPPTTDHALVAQAVDDANYFRGFGGTAIGDAIATAVQVGLRSAGVSGSSVSTLQAPRSLAAYVTAKPRAASTLVSILFLSDGHQTRGTLAPLEGAQRAKAAGIPVYTVALGTPGGTLDNPFGGGPNSPMGPRRFNVAPDPRTLRAIAETAGGKFIAARSQKALRTAYTSLGSHLGRTPAQQELTSRFVLLAALLLVVAGVVSRPWVPRLP